MINKKAIPDLELSLCSKCASVYYNDNAYFIERADYNELDDNQVEHKLHHHLIVIVLQFPNDFS